MKSVPDFVSDYRPSKDLIFLGQCPSSRVARTKNGTFARLEKWAKYLCLTEWSFHNVIPDKVNSYSLDDVDVKGLHEAVKGKKRVIALGGFVERACRKHGIECFRVDHPSSRNRNFNDPSYEPQMLERLKEYLKHED